MEHVVIAEKTRAIGTWTGWLLSAVLFGAGVLSAAEPAPTTTTPASAPATSTSAAVETASPWLASFPPAQRRSLGSGANQQHLILWSPEAPWRGDILLIPGISNAAHFNSPMLKLAARLSQAGWRCLLLAREPGQPLPAATDLSSAATSTQAASPSDPQAITTTVGRARTLTSSELQALLTVLGSEPAPTERAEQLASTDAPRFLLTQADSGELGWAEAAAADSRFAGIVLLGTEQLPDALSTQAPARPLLELQFRQQGRHAASAVQNRQQRWQRLPTYQQQTLIASPATPIDRWLGNTIDGWLRKISLQQTASTDDSLKRQMTAQGSGGNPASP